MKELLRRLAGRPLIAFEIIAASLFANALALASPLFVMQVLNRYVAYGVDATLVTLTAGVLLAILFEFAFRQARHALAVSVVGTGDAQRAIGAFGLLITAKRSAIDTIPVGERRETLRGLEVIETAYSAPNVGTLMDVPFALLFVAALAALNPLLGLISLGFVIAVLLFGIASLRLLRKPQKSLAETAAQGSALVASSDLSADTIRAFNAHRYAMAGWMRYVQASTLLRRRIAGRQGLSQTLTQSAQAVLGVVIIATGAVLVVLGHLDVGTLIGANILASRALGPVTRLAQLAESLARAETALQRTKTLADLPVENEGGSTLAQYGGRLELRDVSFAHSGSAAPLFESLSLALPAGSVLMVRGANGTGKTTLARLLLGLAEPDRGQILADGVDLRQLDPAWWRAQVSYLPQEPRFLDGTLLDNLRTVNPEVDEAALNRIVREAGLGRFIDESREGFGFPIYDNGRRLSVGVRKRLGLARALVADGRLVVFDDPTEGLDAEGRRAVYSTLKSLAERGRTIILITDDPILLRGARLVLDLDSKPVPRVFATNPLGAAAGDTP